MTCASLALASTPVATHTAGQNAQSLTDGCGSPQFNDLCSTLFPLVDGGAEDFLHGQIRPAALGRQKLVATIGPYRMGESAKGSEALVVALLVSVINSRTRKNSIAVMFIGTCRRYSRIWSAPCRPAVQRLAEVNICHVPMSRRIVPGIVEGDVHIAIRWINCQPMIEPVYEGQLVREG